MIIIKEIFIRVTNHNKTKEGVEIDYTIDDIYKICNTLINDYNFKIKIYFIQHGSDYTCNDCLTYITPHFHILIKSEKDIEFFDLRKYFPFSCIEKCRNYKNCFNYLTHYNFNFKKDFYNLEDIIFLERGDY